MLLVNARLLVSVGGVVRVGTVYFATEIWNILDIAQHVREDVIQFLVLLLFICGREEGERGALE